MPFTASELVALGRVSAVAPSPDGTWLAVAVSRLDSETQKYASNLWRVPLDGTPPVQLTHGAHNDRAPSFRSDGALGFLSKRSVKASGGAPVKGGDEEEDDASQVFVLPPGGGDAIAVTDEPLGVSTFAFAERGDRLIVVANVLLSVAHSDQRKTAKDRRKKGPSALHYTALPARHWDDWFEPAAPHVIAYDAHGRDRHDLTPNADREYRGDLIWTVSADGGSVALPETRPAGDRFIDTSFRVIDTKTGASYLLDQAPSTTFDRPIFSPDGKKLAGHRNVRSREAPGKFDLVLFDLGKKSMRVLASSWDRSADPHAFFDDHTILVTADDEGHVPAFTVDTETDSVTRLTRKEFGGGHDGLRAIRGRKEIAGIRHTATQPPEPFSVALAKDSEPRLVARLSGFTDAHAALVEVETFWTESTDGQKVHTHLVKPRGVARPPVLLWIHGGPIGAFGDIWHFRWNALTIASLGFAIALPNARGSTGYGQAFVDGIWKNQWGAQCYEDLMRVADALEARGDVDGKRMCAMGGSFGGYMSNWIGGKTTRFRCIITHASVFHFDAFCGATDYSGYFKLEIDGAPYRGNASFRKYSPHTNVDAWKTPTLVIHGEKDYRIPISEGLMLFDALQERGVPSELLVFPDENHWILRPRNILEWYGRVLTFLAKYL